MRGLTGRTAIVTGGASATGRAIVERLAEEGMAVMVADIDHREGEKLVDRLGGPDNVRFTECDVAERLDVRNLLAATINAFGRVDCLVNNAAVSGAAPFLTLTGDEFDRIFNVNLRGAFFLSQAVARHMVERVEEGRRPGTIINVGSVIDKTADAESAAYSLSKASLSQLTKVSALALAPHGIRVNGVGPGQLVTANEAVVAKPNSIDRPRQIRLKPTDPTEIAALVAFLASDEASAMNGQTLAADGVHLPVLGIAPT